MADSLVVEVKNKKEAYWISYINGRIKKKKNFLGFIGGPTGSGKSWSGVSICEQGDPTFGPDRIITSMRQLMKLINSGKLKDGSWIFWDEAGIDISSKNWQQLTNKLINFLFQTFRHKRLVLIFTSPYLDFIDASTRKLFHAEFMTNGINYENNTCRLKPQLIQYNHKYKKFYYKYLRVRTLDRGVAPLKMWNVSKPSQWLIDEYERIKTDFTTSLNNDIERQLDEAENKKSNKIKKELTPIQKEVLTLMAKYNDINHVAEDIGVTARTIWFHISQSRKKGYKVEDFKGNNGTKEVSYHENEM
jgi:hypothetical protein